MKLVIIKFLKNGCLVARLNEIILKILKQKVKVIKFLVT